MISSFSQPKLEKSAALILKGLIVCIKESGTLRNEIINTPDFWSIIERIHTVPPVSAGVFSLLKAVVEDRAPAVTADNYEFVIGLLNSFANAGGAAAASRQQREPSIRRPQPQEEAQPRSGSPSTHPLSRILTAFAERTRSSNEAKKPCTLCTS